MVYRPARRCHEHTSVPVVSDHGVKPLVERYSALVSPPAPSKAAQW